MHWVTYFEPSRETIEGLLRYFKCKRCNHCEKTVENGIYVRPRDIVRICVAKGYHFEDFVANHTIKKENGNLHIPFPCEFFDGSGCSIYKHRPSVCRQFPFNQSVQCGDRKLVTIDMECPAARDVAAKFGIDPTSIGVEVE